MPFGPNSGVGGVTSITGTANQVTASASTGAVTLSIPAAFIAPGSIQATTTYNGLNGQTITGDANGGWTITANGTNQNNTLTPSGTGTNLLKSTNSAGECATIQNTSASGFSEIAYWDNGGANALNIGYGNASTSSPYTSSAYFRSNSTGIPIKFIQGSTVKGMFAVTTGNFLLGGLTTDDTSGGNKVLQIPGTKVVSIGATSAATIGVSADTTAGVLTLTAPSVGSFSLAGGVISSYNGITTAGNGVATVQAAGRATAQVAANASVSTYTVGASDASFLVFGNVLVTTATAHSFSMTCAYTDEGNTSRTVTLGFFQLTGGTVITLITNVTGATPYESIPFPIRCKANTAITFATAGTFTTVVYNAEGFALKNS